MSSHHLNEYNEEDDEEDDMDTKAAVQQVVGARPMYAGNFNFNVCAKISLRLDDFLRRYNPTKMGRRKIAGEVIFGHFILPYNIDMIYSLWYKFNYFFYNNILSIFTIFNTIYSLVFTRLCLIL